MPENITGPFSENNQEPIEKPIVNNDTVSSPEEYIKSPPVRPLNINPMSAHSDISTPPSDEYPLPEKPINSVSNSSFGGYTRPYQGPRMETPSQYPQYARPVNTEGSYEWNPANVPSRPPKPPKKPASKGFVAAMLAISITCSSLLGFGGGYMANKMNTSNNDSINITKVDSNNVSTTNASGSNLASSIVKKTADSVVEIETESVKTSSFAQQYIVQGAGSGVIVSDDGYIITNNHVIDGANNITVTLRDGKTNYTAAVIGKDSENDIALLKVDAKDLPPATFGDSSKLSVGDYVVAIGNPLGELGGTVTDGIISALARDVTIEGEDMTLLQTNAQISPGNSGGGLFNASGELVGIVNAKDSATEVEGIAFAIPVNNVLDIITDLKSYGYVTGKVDLGMQFLDISARENAYYYGLNRAGCYISSITPGSNAEQAGFKVGDIITKVNGTDISTSAEIEKLLKNSKVGDIVKFTVYRNKKTEEVNLKLAEYVPSNKNQQASKPENNIDDIFSELFGF